MTQKPITKFVEASNLRIRGWEYTGYQGEQGFEIRRRERTGTSIIQAYKRAPASVRTKHERTIEAMKVLHMYNAAMKVLHMYNAAMKSYYDPVIINLKSIRARLNEGMTINDFKLLIYRAKKLDEKHNFLVAKTKFPSFFFTKPNIKAVNEFYKSEFAKSSN